MAGRAPGPIGLGSKEALIGGGNVAGFPAARGTRGSSTVPGPVGRHYVAYATPDGSGGATTTAKKKALIIIGAGQEAIKAGRDDKQFDEAAKSALAKYVKGYDVTLKHVRSAAETIKLLESGQWDTFIYFGHGVLNEKKLDPGHDAKALLTESDLISALKKAQPSKVYLLGCSSGETGLARSVAKQLPGTNVYGTFGLLDATWASGKSREGPYSSMTFNQPFTEYTDGFQTENGKKTKQRRAERGDPINIGAAPLDEPMVDQ